MLKRNDCSDSSVIPGRIHAHTYGMLRAEHRVTRDDVSAGECKLFRADTYAWRSDVSNVGLRTRRHGSADSNARRNAGISHGPRKRADVKISDEAAIKARRDCCIFRINL